MASPTTNTPILMPVDSGLSFATDLQPERFRQMLRTSPMRQRIRWWRAFPDPSGGKGILYVEVPDAINSLALVQPIAKNVERYFPFGSLPTGGIVLTTLPDQLPVGNGDIVAPWGKDDRAGDPTIGPATIPNAAWQSGRAVLRRGQGVQLLSDAPEQNVTQKGAVRVALAGTVSFDTGSNVLTGVGTTFTTDLTEGDLITASGGELGIVASIASDTSLLLASAYAPATPWNSCAYARLDDALPEVTTFQVDAVMNAAQNLLDASLYKLSSDGLRVLWNALPDGTSGGVPAPGEAYTVVYRYIPRFVVLNDLVQQAPPVQGQFLPQTVACARASGGLTA